MTDSRNKLIKKRITRFPKWFKGKKDILYFIVAPKSKLPKEIYKQLESLNLRSNGSMIYSLRDITDYKVYILLNKSDKVISWSIYCYCYKVNSIYTRKKYRHKGYASLLVKEMKNYKKKGKIRLWYNGHSLPEQIKKMASCLLNY